MSRRLLPPAPAISAAAFALALAAAAHADTRPGVQVSFTGLTVARAGQPINAQATIRASEPVTLKSFQSLMRGTTVTSDAPADSLVMPAGGERTIHLSVVPISNDDELVLAFTANGHKYVFQRDLSQFWSDVRNYGQTVGFDPQPEPPIVPAPELLVAPEVPEPLPAASLYGRPVMDLAQAARMAQATGVTATETHTIQVRLRYGRPDNKADDVDGASYTLWLKAPGVDVPIASGISNADGRGTHTLTLPTALGRTCFVTFRTTNGWVHVLNNNDDDEPYRFKSVEFTLPVGGGATNKAFLVSSTGPVTPSLHMLTTVTRGFRFVLAETPFQYPGDIDDLDVSWPESDWPHYLWPLYETFYIPNDSGWNWNTRTMLHEFGHHVNWELPMEINQQDYSDGNCEDEGEDGHHCRWCGEDDLNVAVMEGFASWFGDMVASKWEQNYGTPIYDPNGDIDNELIPQTMPDSPCPGGWSGDRCEGFFWALLRDLADATDEQDPLYGANQLSLPSGRKAPQDALSLGFGAVLDLFMDYDINIVQDFKNAFFGRYGGSLAASDIWNTFSNAGYWYDNTRPTQPTNIHSTDHSPGVASADNSITFTWNPSVDMQSGVWDHRFSLRRSSDDYQISGGPTEDVPGNTVTFPDVPPGSYYLNVIAKDRAGNESLASGANSPVYVVRSPTPTDLDDWFRSGWEESEVVARVTNNATTGSVTVPPYLAGDKDSTWFNWAVQNTGETDVTSTYRTRLLVDGVVIDSVMSTTFLGVPQNAHTVVNRGPFNLRPGRHTIELWTDAEEEIAEPNEADNRFGRQWVWDPSTTEPRNTDIVENAPPRRDGGRNALTIPPGSTFDYSNCIAHRYSHLLTSPPFGTTTWMAVELWAEQPANRFDLSGVNYDLKLDMADKDPYYGFGGPLASSSRGLNLADAVITNYANSNTLSWEVGVVNMTNDTTDYHLRVNTGGSYAVGDSFDVVMAANQMVAIRGISVASGDVGKITYEARRIAGTSPVRLSYLASSTHYSTLAGALGDAPTNSSGIASTSFTASVTGSYALLLWRDPGDGTATVTYRVSVRRKPVDLAIVTPAGWDAPIVPRVAVDATTSWAPRPAILYGDDKITVLNLSRRNLSDVTSTSAAIQVRIDDQFRNQYNATTAALTTVTQPNLLGIVVPGGRHVLTQLLDPAGAVIELDELNNTYGEQYVWTPDTVLSDQARWRAGQFGGPTAGWEYCVPGSTLLFNMDGVRLPVWGSGSGVDFAAVAVTARDSADVDLGLYLAQNNAKGGFDVPQEDSNWGAGQTDLVLLNFTLAQRKAYDAGILRSSDDTTSYVVDVVPGVVRNPATPVHGPFTLAASRLVHVHQFALPAGRHTFHLRNLAGAVDWAMALYDAERPFQDRSQGEERGWSFAAGPGGDEEIVFVAEQPMTVALVVHKAGSADLFASGSYQLELGTNTTGAGPLEHPAATALAAAYPNPFRADAALRFDLARAGEVLLEVYDLRGARVRTLAEGPWAAGRHAVRWDGLDEHGRPASPGVYLVRLRADGYDGRTKVVRVH